MSILPPELPEGLPDYLGYVFAPRKARNVRRYGELTERGRARDIGYVKRAYGGNLSDREAARIAAERRRRGYVPRSVRSDRANEEDLRAAEAYRRRQEAARRGVETKARLRNSAVRVVTYIVDEYGNVVTDEILVAATSLSRSDRRLAAAHRNNVHAFLAHGNNPQNVESLLAYEGKFVTDKTTGAQIPLEYDPSRLETWYVGTMAGQMFSPEEFYLEAES